MNQAGQLPASLALALALSFASCSGDDTLVVVRAVAQSGVQEAAELHVNFTTPNETQRTVLRDEKALFSRNGSRDATFAILARERSGPAGTSHRSTRH